MGGIIHVANDEVKNNTMKLHLPPKFTATFFAALVSFTHASGTDISDAALHLENFNEDSLSAAVQNGWTFTDITSSEDGTFTSTASQGIITCSTPWASVSDSGWLTLWSCIVTINVNSLGYGNRGVLIETAPNVSTAPSSRLEGIAYYASYASDNQSLMAANWGTMWPNLTVTNELRNYADDEGMVTVGMVYKGDGGTSLYVGGTVASDNNLMSSNKSEGKPAIFLGDHTGIQYRSLYLFGESVSDADMVRMLTSLRGSVTWTGSTDSNWDMQTPNWVTTGTETPDVFTMKTDAIFGVTAQSKTVNVVESVTAEAFIVDDDYTFNVISGADLSAESLIVSSDKRASFSGEGAIVIGTLVGAIDIAEETAVYTSNAITLTDSNTLQVSGKGKLIVTTLQVNGGAHTITNALEVTGGGDGTGRINRALGLAVTNEDATVTLAGDTYITGALYAQAGSVNIGDGTGKVRVETNRVEFGDTRGNATSILNVRKNATLHVIAEDKASSYDSTGLLMGEWNGVSVVNVAGKLYADQATAYVGDSTVTFNIEDGGLMAVKGFSQNQHKGNMTETINLNLQEGGTLVLGATGITSQKPINVSFAAGEVGISDYNVEIAKDVTLSGSGTTFNTNVYGWQGYYDSLELAPGLVGGTITISGNITGEGSIIKKGDGTLVLAGNNNILTHTIQLREGSLELVGTFNVTSLVNEPSGSFIDGENEGNGFLYTPDSVAHVVEITDGAYLECLGVFTIYGTQAEFDWATGDARVDAKTYYTTYYINKAYTQESLAHAIDASGNQLEEVRLENTTALNVDSKGVALAQLTLAENADAELNVTADATIGKISDLATGHTLTVKGYNESALTIGMLDEKSFSGLGDLVVDEGANVILRGNNSDYCGIVYIKGNLTVGNAAALGAGSVQVRGGGLDLDCLTIANSVTATGTSTVGNGTLTGVLTVDNAALTINEDLTLGGNLVVENENRIEVADGATLYLTRTITNENYIELAGRIDISAISGTETGSSYVGGETEGNGFLQAGYEMMLIDCGLSGDFDWREAEIYHSGNEVTKEDWGGVTYSVTDASNFYIFRGTERVSTARSMDANTIINLSSGTTLNVDEDVNLNHIQASGAASINIEEGKKLSGYTASMNLTLTGMGLYELESRTSLGSLALGNDWSGTVQLSGSATYADFNDMVRTGSWLELKGFSGYPTTYNGTTSANIILTDKEDGTVAFTATYGSTYDYGYTMKFSGVIKGEGTFVVNTGSTRYENYEFAGDISGWSGKFQYASGRNTKLTISGNAHEVNAAVDGGSGLTLCVNTSTVFNEAVGVNGLTLNNSSATFNGPLQVGGSITASGSSALAISEGQTLSLGTAIANSGKLTLSGKFDVSGQESTILSTEYLGGVTPGNGYGLSLYGIRVVQNTGSATLDWNAAEVVYSESGYTKRADGSITKGDGVYDNLFHVQTGEERVSTAQDVAKEVGIIMHGIELKDGTKLTVDRAFTTAEISLVSGSAILNVENDASLQSDGTEHSELSLVGEGIYKLAVGSAAQDIDWSSQGWKGTIVLTDAVQQDWDLNNYGHAGSKVGLDGVSGNFARPTVCGEIVPTLVLTGDGLTVTACYTNSTYTFSGGVAGDGNWTYGLTGNPHNQTYIFTGDVSQWTGAYESIVDGKISTLKFDGDAVEMGAAIKAIAGTVNVEVGNGTDAFATTFGNDITASSLKVLDKAAATLTKDTTIAGEIEVAGGLKIQGEGRLNVGDAVRMGAVDEGSPATLADVDISSSELSARGEEKAELSGLSITTMEDFKLENVRLDGSFIDIGEDTTFYIKKVEISADTRITDGAAHMFIEGGKAFLDESNTGASAPTMSLADVTFYRSGDTETWVTLHENVSLVSLTSELFTKVMLTGTDLWLDLTGLSAQVGDATAFSVSFEDGALFDVDSLRVYATLNGEKYLDGYTTQQSGGATTLYFSQQIPEPTTSTLSLLALAALATRRRRTQ